MTTKHVLHIGLAAAFLVTVFAAGAFSQIKTSAKKAAADDFWTTDWDKAIAAAKAQKKPVIVDFYTDWCGWCKKLDKETYAAPEIKKRLKEGWIGVKINPEDETKKGTLDGAVVKYSDIARKYNVRGFPTIIFLDKDGKEVKLEATINYVPKEPFGPLLDYVKNEHYKKNISLDKYIKDSMRK